jgi:hypothetical protein
MHEHGACQRVGIDDVGIDSATVRQRGWASDPAEQQVAPGLALEGLPAASGSPAHDERVCHEGRGGGYDGRRPARQGSSEVRAADS